MKLSRITLTFTAACLAAMLTAQESKPPTTLKALKDRAERGKLSDQREMVRGDTGKWNDHATLQHVPPIQQKPKGISIDDWTDQLADKEIKANANEDNWVIFRSRQLDDNDRVWVEKIEQRGNEFTVLLDEAIWKGHYFKTFTFYQVEAVNLGKLPPGNYTVKWVVKPLVFDHFEDPGKPQDNWPKDERPTDAKPVELKTAFSVEPAR